MTQSLGLPERAPAELGRAGCRASLKPRAWRSAAGESVWIANGKQPDILRKIIRGERLGTSDPCERAKASLRGSDGLDTPFARAAAILSMPVRAMRPCIKGKSLLPVGVVDVEGDFAPGDVVALEHPAGTPFARGLTQLLFG